jgi:putative SOS response-associated peptidase YedK
MHQANILHRGPDGERLISPMRWGFSKKNAKTPARPDHMHARAETVDTLPTFAEAFARRRAILTVRTFNVGEELPNGKTKQWVVTPKDGAPLGLAVICERWVNGVADLWTFVQVSAPANRLLAQVTDAGGFAARGLAGLAG